MARSLESTARFKIQRRLGLELPGLGKYGALERRPYPPGQHGQRRRKISEYAVRLMEKQKLIFHYGIREKQLVRWVKQAKKDKTRAWVDTLVINLERRLDNVIFRLNMAPSIPAARQMVTHGHVLVNGKKLDRCSAVVNVGDEIQLSEKGYKSQNYQTALQSPRLSGVPACYEVSEFGENFKKAKVTSLPLPEDIPFEFAGRLVTEYYWKIKA